MAHNTVSRSAILCPPGLLIANTLTDPTTETLIIGSDGSLHLHEQVAAAAWIISTGDTKHLAATFLMTNISSYTSHRIELEGISVHFTT